MQCEILVVLRILACLDTGRKGSGASSEKVFGVWELALKNYTYVSVHKDSHGDPKLILKVEHPGPRKDRII